MLRTLLSLILVFARADVDGATWRGAREQRTQVCYPDVGCFTNAAPFTNAKGRLPQSPKEIGTKFYLYTRQNPVASDVLNYTSSANLAKSHFNPRNPVRIAVHGFAMSMDDSLWYHPLRDAFLFTEPTNVILVGWKNGAKIPKYLEAVSNTRLVAKQISLLIKLMLKMGTDLSNIHLIGHSLGAQISGYVGAEFKGQLGRISGLDPAGPNYENESPEVRLDPTDAIFVDVIHSNGAPFYRGGAGTSQPCGDVDFYLNGGRVQPGCDDLVSGSFTDLLHGRIEDAFDVVSCSHSRSHDIYVETINLHCPFTAYPCTDFNDFLSGKCLSCGSWGCNHLGYQATNSTATGRMMLLTKGESPYCGYHYKFTATPLVGKNEKPVDLVVVMRSPSVSTDPLIVNDLDVAADGASRVVISRENLHDVTAIDVTFEKTEGHHFLGWGERVELTPMKFDIMNAETGERFVFCMSDSTLALGETKHLERSEDQTCM